MELNHTAREQLRNFGVSTTRWAQQHFGTDAWHGDACGCPDDRCIGFHHDDPDDCGCLPALLTSRAQGPTGTPEQDPRPAAPADQELVVAVVAAHVAGQPPFPAPPLTAFRAAFEGWTPNPDDLEHWPNSVRVEAVEGYDPTFTGQVTKDDFDYADPGEVRQLVEVDTNYKSARHSEHAVRLTRADAVRLAGALLEAAEDTFHFMRCGRLRPAAAKELLDAIAEAEWKLHDLREHALHDLLIGTGLAVDELRDDPTASDTTDAADVPVSKPTPVLAQPAGELERREPPAEDAGEVSFTLEQQFGDALGAVFGNDLHAIASSDAYGALKYKVLHRCQRTGETPRAVLDTVSASDRAFAARANDPAAFLASRMGDER